MDHALKAAGSGIDTGGYQLAIQGFSLIPQRIKFGGNNVSLTQA